MSLYDNHILPRLLDCACGIKPAREQREKVVPRAYGDVLEVGIGTGLNVPFYNPERVDKVWGLDPSLDPQTAAHKLAARRIARSPIEFELLGLSGEAIPMEPGRFDTVLLTFTLCSIPDPLRALREMRRVLKPGGQLLFSEHGRAPEARVRRWQDRLTPVWRHIAGGCHLNRAIPELIGHGDFALADLQETYLPGPKPLTYNYWGMAKPV